MSRTCGDPSTRSPTTPCQPCRRWSDTSQPLPCKCRSGFLNSVCFHEHELSAGPGMCFPTILNHKGPEGWDYVCFRSCTNFKDHKDTLKGHIDSLYSLSVPRFIKECGLKKGLFGKADVALSWPVRGG